MNDISPIALRNRIVKITKGHVSWCGDSNPYDDFRTLEVSCSGDKTAKVEKWAKDEGFDEDETRKGGYWKVWNRGKNTISICFTKNVDDKRGATLIQCTGPKKAKRITLPYYD